MNILIVTPIFPPQIGGPATYAYELAKRLAPNHKITIVSFGRGLERVEGAKIVSMPLFGGTLGKIKRQLFLAVAIATAAKKADVIYAQGALVIGFASSLIAKLTRKPLIIKFVGDEVWEEALRKQKTGEDLEGFLANPLLPPILSLERWFQTQTLSVARNIIVPSRYLKAILTKYYRMKESKIAVIPNAVDISTSDTKSTRNTIIMSSGRLVPHKRYDLVISAFAELLGKAPTSLEDKLVLHIIGEGSSKEDLEVAIRRLKLSGKVKLVGLLPKQKYLQSLRMARIFVIASSYEGLPHAIIEAMLSGVPVVATDIPGNREVIDNEKTGLLVPGSSKDIAEAMRRILTNEKFAKTITENAERNAKNRFGWKTHLELLIHLFGQEPTQGKTG